MEPSIFLYFCTKPFFINNKGVLFASDFVLLGGPTSLFLSGRCFLGGWKKNSETPLNFNECHLTVRIMMTVDHGCCSTI